MKYENFDEFIEETKYDNWDDDHGLFIPKEYWHGAFNLYRDIVRETKFEPIILPCGDGTIHFNFFGMNGNFLLIEYIGNELSWILSDDNRDTIDHSHGLFEFTNELCIKIFKLISDLGGNLMEMK